MKRVYAFLFAVFTAGAAPAQSDRPVRFILPNATGSGVDAITRSAQPALSKALGASILIDNQPGAGGVLGLQSLARSAPDGNSLSVVSNNVVIFPSVLKSLPFDMPGDFNFASSGNGTILHLATELYLDAAGVTAKHIPYKGVGAMAKMGNTIRIGTPEQAQAAFRSELVKYAAMVKKVGLEPQ